MPHIYQKQKRAVVQVGISFSPKLPRQQWGCPNHLPNHQSCYVLGSQGRTWCAIHKSMRSHFPATPPHRNGPSPTTHSHTNRQLHSPWRCHQHHPTQMNQSYGHAFPLALLSNQPKAFSHLLAHWSYQLSRLCHQASPRHPSPSCLATIPNRCTTSTTTKESVSLPTPSTPTP